MLETSRSSTPAQGGRSASARGTPEASGRSSSGLHTRESSGRDRSASRSRDSSANNAAAHTPGSSMANFNIDSFDFGADFSLPSGLDDLNIYHHGAAAGSVTHSAPGSITGAPSPAAGSSSGKGGAAGGGGSGSRHGSPRSAHVSAANLAGGTGSTAAGSPLANLLLSMNGTEGNSAAQLLGLNSNHLSHLDARSQSQHPQDRQLSISDLQRILAEKEHAERLQNLQTAVLRQQLEALQRQTEGRGGDNSQQRGNQPQQQQNGGLSVNTNAFALQQLQQQQQQHLLAMATQASQGITPTQSNAQSPFVSPFSSTSPHSQIGNPFMTGQPLAQNGGGMSSSGAATSSAMAQYGLLTPMNSGAFNSSSQAHMPFTNGSFTPLESPAITPASVFSNASTATTTADFFSPLTSPALRPQIPTSDLMLPPSASSAAARLHAASTSPAFGPQRTGAPPSASPLALMGHSKPLPRKNRSTTAEARANKMRPSPLVKPTAPARSGRSRGDSAASSGLTSPATATPGEGHSRSGSGSQNRSTISSSAASSNSAPAPSSTNSSALPSFTPVMAGSGKSLDASPSEGAASTPSPIDLSASSMPPPPAPSNSKPLTPGSIMGIAPKSGTGNGNGLGGASSSSSSKAKQKAAVSDAKAVTFAEGADSNDGSPGTGSNGNATQPNNGGVGGALSALRNIAPGHLSAAEKEEWTVHKAAGGGALDSRRTSHKAAEQKRRDSLKYCFDELRGMLPAITLDDDAPGGSYLGSDGRAEDIEVERFDPAELCDGEASRLANRAISKVALLRHSNEYLVRIASRLVRRDKALLDARAEIVQLRSALGLPPSPSCQFISPPPIGYLGGMGHQLHAQYGLEMVPGAHQLHLHQHPHQHPSQQSTAAQQDGQQSHAMDLDMDISAA
ncbi:MLX INTERACTOR ALPHA [Ceraceosorus bombacis]|uniref:MLX INTERACTOR ALPHA n=1 Tax=Ceraceosorus bombacis TaxID=401625 RepID=A0A0P1BBG8_9BASI|nr:MLX INTERACTOR ALPHA [Ceraceosorus bombacis]